MRLTVDHVTRYHYANPVRSVIQSHRLTPSVHAGQKVIEWQVTVSGGEEGARFRDGAGNIVQGWTIAGPVEEIAVAVRGVVETSETHGILKGHRESIMPVAYLRSTAATAPSKLLAELAASAAEAPALDLAHALSAAVSDAVRYMPGVTAAHTTAAEALAMGEGVCQDHAHVLIALARLRGLPARYISGYLLAGDGLQSAGEGEEAAHAWAEIHVPGLGWVGFDPANRCCPDERYIRLASGFDAREAAPIRGVARSHARASNDERLEVAVAVRAADQ